MPRVSVSTHQAQEAHPSAHRCGSAWVTRHSSRSRHVQTCPGELLVEWLLSWNKMRKNILIKLQSIVQNNSKANYDQQIYINVHLPPAFEGAEVCLFPSSHAFPSSGMLRGMQRVTGVTWVSSRWQSWAISQLCLSGIHDGHHPVPGGNQLFLNIVLIQEVENISYLIQTKTKLICIQQHIQSVDDDIKYRSRHQIFCFYK